MLAPTASLLALLAVSSPSEPSEPGGPLVLSAPGPQPHHERSSSPSGPATTSSPTTSTSPSPSTSQWNRRGPLLAASVGFTGCRTDSCYGYYDGMSWRYRGGMLGQVELGYRVKHLAPIVGAGVSIGPMQYTGALAGLEGTMRLIDVGAGLMVFPLARGRVDPYFGARMGYARAAERATLPGTDVAASIIYSRGGARFTAGVGFYVTPSVTVGPRFDFTLPTGGGVCSTVVGGGEPEQSDCYAVSQLVPNERSDLPRWWSASLDFRVVLPRAERHW